MERSTIPAKLKKQRTLAAVVFTDGVNFSARMSVDEEHTLELIRRDLELMQELCEQQFEGHVLKSTGDGLLMYFSSAVQAVSCALEIQKQLAEVAALLPPSDILSHRIGIHLGDVFITESDVMGNGVNIAARLQTEAAPGSVCVSQIVYDVVKTSLSLNATYLGPLILKNIHEAIPAYRLSLFQEDDFGGETVSHPDEPSTSPITPLHRPTLFTPPQDPLDPVMRSIRDDRNVARIKKLLVCVCRNYWESDPVRLEQLNLRNLLQELQRLNPSLAELTFNLERVVTNLSKPEQYSQVSSAILRYVKPLYPDTPEPPTDLYSSIAQALAQSKDLSRIKKLLYCVWTDQWESDQTALDNLDLRHLLREVHAVAPTLEHLTLSLNNIVRTLSKPEAYALIANTIAAQFSKLYLGSAAVVPPLEEATQMTNAAGLATGGMTTGEPTHRSLSSQPPTSDSTYVMASSVDAFSAITEAITAPRQGATFPTQPPASIPIKGSNPPSFLTVEDYITSLDLQRIKQDVMSYTIPMRAKILAFSVLYQKFNFNAHDWGLIRLHRLDDLLKRLLHEFDTLKDLEARLEILAHCLEEPDEYLQAAGIITQAMESSYQTRPKNLIKSSSIAIPPGEPGTSLPINRVTFDADTSADHLATDDLATRDLNPAATPDSDDLATKDLTPPPNPANPGSMSAIGNASNAALPNAALPNVDDDRTRQL